MIKQMPKYEAYKDSGVEWIGAIPATWQICRMKYLLSERNERTTTGKEPLLALSKYRGVVLKDSFEERAGRAESLVGYKKVAPNQLVINKMQAVNGLLSVSYISGITSPDYSVYEVKHADILDIEFLNYTLNLPLYLSEFKRRVTGVMEGFIRLYTDDLYDIPLLLPPIEEQKDIVRLLKNKSAIVDDAIAIKQNQIELLKERKQIIIQQAVTQGLNPDAPMKDSGVDWIGEIPEHWIVKRAKYLLDEINERSETGLEELLSVSHMTGVTPRSEKNVTMFMAEDYTGSKLCHSGDLVINIMWAWMGALGVSDRTGIVSPSYGVFREQREGTFVPKYLEMLLKSTKYVEYYNKVSTGLHSSRLRFYGHMLFDMALGFPPYEEQTQIVEYISRECSKVDEAITVQAEQVSKLKEYKTTLINSAVTGKIKVTELV
ncbi:TPA: restriction endonuclease subunit S [Vibrio cholerae]|nr:restriction endonuclease subunit S [Vibrio cholerae]